MAKMLVCYYSRTGHTKHMAEELAEGGRGVEGVEVDLRAVADVQPKEMLDFDAIAIGSPAYYGTMAAELKKFLDDSVSFHGKLNGKVGAAFASSANVGGGNETTVLDIAKAMLIHGMVIQGSPGGDHYGAVAIGDPDDRAREQCQKFGRIAAELAVKLHG
ncbi:MAG: flavodoxin domain-containing protein [Planctomycetota bacterium]